MLHIIDSAPKRHAPKWPCAETVACNCHVLV